MDILVPILIAKNGILSNRIFIRQKKKVPNRKKKNTKKTDETALSFSGKLAHRLSKRFSEFEEIKQIASSPQKIQEIWE
jgi:hypothetical protein